MRSSTRVRFALIALSAMAVFALVRTSLRAQSLGGGMFGGQIVEGGAVGGVGGMAESQSRIYVSAPVTAEAAATWQVLRGKISMPFANETPLGDVLRYIRSATAAATAPPAGDDVAREDGDTDEASGPQGVPALQIYLDPIGLQDADKSAESMITLELENVPIATALRLALEQLGLGFYVQEDGIVVIDEAVQARAEGGDPSLEVLNTLEQLRSEVAALRSEVAALRGGRVIRPGGIGSGGIQ